MAKKRKATSGFNRVNHKEKPKNEVNNSITGKIFKNSSLQQEQVDLLNGSFLSKKEDRINIMHSNIVKNNISWDQLKNRKTTLDMLKNYKQRDDLPLIIQDAIMRTLASKILINLDVENKKLFGNKFDSLLRSKVQIDIKTLDEFKPFLEGIKKNKLDVNNDEVFDYLNDHKITSTNPSTEIKNWSLFDTNILLELLNFEQKNYFDNNEKIVNNEIIMTEQFFNLPNLGERNIDKKDQAGEIYEKILKQKNEKKLHIENEIRKLKETAPEDKDTWGREDYKRNLGRELGAKQDLENEIKLLESLWSNLNIENSSSNDKIFDKNHKQLLIAKKKIKQKIENKIKKLEKGEKLDEKDEITLQQIEKEIKWLEEMSSGPKDMQTMESYLQNIDSSGICKILNLDKKDLKDFVQTLEKLDNKSQTISISSKFGKNLELKIKKSFDKEGGMNLDLNLNYTAPEALKRLEDPKNIMTSESINKNGLFYSVFGKNGEIRLADGYKIKIDNKYEGYLNYSLNESDFQQGELNKKNYPDMFDEKGYILESLAFLCDDNGNVLKDNDGKYIYTHKDNAKTKTIEILDRKISLKGDKVNTMVNIFYGWNSRKLGIEGMKSILKVDENQAKQEINAILEEELGSNNDIKIGEPSFEEVIQNAKLNDKERMQKATELFAKILKENGIINKIELNTQLFKTILDAHYSTVIEEGDYNSLENEDLKSKYKKIGNKYYEIGKDEKRIAGIYNYSNTQIREKLKILKNNKGFKDWQIKALLKYGICGIDPDSIQDKQSGEDAAQQWIKENEEHYYDGELESEYAVPEAEDYYNKLGKEGKKSFLKTLKNNDSDIEQLNDIKSELTDYLENPKKNPDNGITDNENKEINEDEETNELSPKEKFDKAWGDINGYKFPESHNGFTPGTRLFLDIGGSLLPPEDVEQSWMELELVDTSREDTFSVKIIGGDVKTDMDGQIVRLPKTHEQLEKMSTGAIHKMPKGNRTDWKDCLSNINKAKIFKKVSVFGSGQNQVTLKGGEFVNGDGEKITHFCRVINTYDIKKEKGGIGKDEMGQTPVSTIYEVKHLKNGKVKVKCNFEGQDPNDFMKNVRHKHEKEMDYTSFMLLMESKQLYGYTEEKTGELDIVQKGDRHAMKGEKLRMFSVMSVINSVKNIGKNINGKLEEYQKEQEEDFVHLLCSHEGLNLYSVMGNAFGMFGGLFSGMEDAMQTAGLEYYADRENRTWKKIEKRYKLFEADPHFSTQWGEKLEAMLMSPGEPKDRYQTAAAFLYLLKKDGPWSRKLYEKMGKGFWVEKFLGKKHAKRFLEMQAQRKAELEEYKKLNIVHRRQPRHTELSRLEFDYLVGVIDGRQPFGGIPGDDEHFQASKRSRTFAEKIGEGADEYFGGFDEKYKKIGRISFRQAEQEWFRHMRNIRPHKALPFLKAMVVNAQSKAEEDRAKSAILGAMLSGVFINMQDHNLRSEFWKISRTMGFLPGLWIRDTEQQDNVVKMLDGITSHPPFEKKFSDATGYKVSDYQIDNFGGPGKIPFLLHTFPRYWKANGKKILEILQFQNRDAENSIINLAENGPNEDIFNFLLEKSREVIREDIDDEVAGTYGFYEHSPLTANKGIISKVMPNRGKFDMSDNNMKEAAQLFWLQVGKEDNRMIPAKRVSRGTTEFIFGKYFNWLEDSVFTQGNLAFLIKGLGLVKKLKKEGKHEEANYYLWYTVYGNVTEKMGGFPPEFAKAMKRFLKFFEHNVDQIDDSMVATVCNNPEAVSYFKKPFESRPMQEFWDEYMSQTTGKKKSDYKKLYGQNPDKYINWQIDTIFRKLTTLNINQPDISSSGVKGNGSNEISKQLAENFTKQDKKIADANKKQTKITKIKKALADTLT